ncbi:MAG TPA: response regulator [Halanaerobiaceae bacterium]|nr:response regulator [Halanaerobiaceae bacterium]
MGLKRVLIVDDAAFMRLNLKNILKDNYEIAGEAENGQEAVEMYQELKPDFVTMDITMPIMDGLEAIKAIKDFDPEANIIVCSAMGQQKMIIKAIEAGAKDFIVKPFKEQRVLEAIEKLRL